MTFAPVTVRYWKQSCPHCGEVYGNTFDIGAVRLGSGHRACVRCFRQFADGSLEWPQLTPKQKRQFLFRGLPIFIVFFGVFAGMVVYAGITTPNTMDTALAIAAGILTLGALLLAIFYIASSGQIRKSKQRYAKGR